LLDVIQYFSNHKSQTWQRLFEESMTEMYDDTKIRFNIPNEEINRLMPNAKTDDSRLIQIKVASNNSILEDKPILNTDTDDIGGM